MGSLELAVVIVVDVIVVAVVVFAVVVVVGCDEVGAAFVFVDVAGVVFGMVAVVRIATAIVNFSLFLGCLVC